MTLHVPALALFAVLIGAASPCVGAPPVRFTISPQMDESGAGSRGFLPRKAHKRPRVALVLSGGGARGVAQIGVLRSFERNGIPVDFITGTSLGAIVGGLYASGYTTAQLEELARSTDWDEVLSLAEESRRRDLVMDQKLADDRSFLALRFQGLEPVIPAAVSSGQRLTDFLSEQALQALYHPDPGFDDLRIPFRAVATDLVSGRRIILADGSLAEALRASATVPLLFNPIEKDSMQLLDGGLVSNIPVDVAYERGYDVIVAVNSTSALRGNDELDAPWKTADQIMGIMMQLSNDRQLGLADLVITPDLGKHLSSDFSGLDHLIAAGDSAAEAKMEEIRALLEDRRRTMLVNALPSMMGAPPEIDPDSLLPLDRLDGNAAGLPGVAAVLETQRAAGAITFETIASTVDSWYAAGVFADASAEVTVEDGRVRVDYRLTPNPELRHITFDGARLVPQEELIRAFTPMLNSSIDYAAVDRALEDLLRLYRSRGYSLARFEHVGFDSASGVLTVAVNEGVVDGIDVRGGVRTRDAFVLREFPLGMGDVFEIGKAKTGLTNLTTTRLFEYVYLEVAYPGNRTLVTIRLKERPSQLMRLGVRIDGERNLQGSLDVRDENFGGGGRQLGLTVSGGARNRDALLEYRANRLFDAYLTYGVAAFTSLTDSYLYGDAPVQNPRRFERTRLEEYRDVRYGARVSFGSQLERLGTATLEYSVQRVRIRSRSGVPAPEESYLLTLLRLGTTVDTKDSYPFPRSGIGFAFSYEIAAKQLGSDVGYNALRLLYESYATWGGSHTFHPRLVVGFADRTMPLGQQFRLGGRESFFGANEDDRRGRQLLLLNVEYRFQLPFRLLFDTYFRVRYDLGSLAAVPEEIKFAAFRHGIGAELALDSPVGPVILAVGRSFTFVRDLPQNPLQSGPYIFYFLVGYQI